MPAPGSAAASAKDSDGGFAVASAGDVETERSLWDNLADTDTTVIVVSHRAVALERADRVVRLEAGRVVGVTSGVRHQT